MELELISVLFRWKNFKIMFLIHNHAIRKKVTGIRKLFNRKEKAIPKPSCHSKLDFESINSV